MGDWGVGPAGLTASGFTLYPSIRRQKPLGPRSRPHAVVHGSPPETLLRRPVPFTSRLDREHTNYLCFVNY